MELIINQIPNAGVSLTDETNKKIISMYNLIRSNENRILSYQEFQKLLITNNIFSGSYIRSIIPFIYNLGIINDYREDINFNNFFTSLGESYIKILIEIERNTSVINDNLLAIKSDIINLMIINMKKNNSKHLSSYVNVLKFIYKHKKINKAEFYIMNYCLENNLNPDDYINNYREQLVEYNIKIRGNDNTIKDYTSNNAFNYVSALLGDTQANLITKLDQSYYVINNSRIKFVENLVK